ncbi:MAG: hypothetical protein Q9181_001143 [Wetmoreana brouardii]
MNVLPPLAPDNTHAPPAFRRSITVPTRLTESPKSSPSSRDGIATSAETLYAHSAGRIVSFHPPVTGTRRHSSVDQGHSALQDEPVGTLPWASTTERTIAAVLEVPFLSFGNRFAKPILSKSQCWCVDGESKFVLPVGPHTYYRIELPNTTAEDRAKVEEFKATLGKILQYETTPCPFKRGFTVDLPEKPDTPLRKKPWKPRERVQPASTAEQVNRRVREPRAWERPRDPAEQLPETDHLSEAKDEMLGESTSPMQDEREGSSDNGHERETTDDQDLTPRGHTMHDHQHFDPFKTPTRPRPLKAGRATTAPPQLSLCTAPPSDTADVLDETASLSSSLNSFHSFHSPISPLPPSPRLPPLSPSPDPKDDRGITIPKARTHSRDDSELTATAAPEDFWQTPEPNILDRAANSAASEPPQTPPLVSDTTSQTEEPSPGPITPLLTQVRHRSKKSTQRCQSPLSPANIYSPTSRLSGHHLTTAILQKTCSLVLGPPVSLVALMLNIASKILDGTYNGFPFGYAEPSHKIPCSWDFSDTDQATDEEDDYGCVLGKLRSRSSSRSKDMGGSWEVD